MKLTFYIKMILCISIFISCASKVPQKNAAIKVAAERTDLYLNLLSDKNVGLIVNHTSTANDKHLIDFLLAQNIKIEKIFTPEHGLKGIADAGELIGNDTYKNIPIISLYGKNKKPTNKQVNNLDVLVFDIQDVGARFYTYISTMHYCMETAAANNIEFIILDRPNPNGHFVDGPVKQKDINSFVAMHPIPIVHGLTVGELAQMINGENWLENNLKCNLKVIPVENYNHKKQYSLPIKPSPNLPNMRSIYLYPSLCLFEGTNISVGRGTNKQFQIYGHPDLPKSRFNFVPKPMEGAKYPKLENKSCNGFDFSPTDKNAFFESAELNIGHLTSAYNAFPNKEKFFLETNFFDLLAGTKTLKQQIINNIPEAMIRASWQDELKVYKAMRKKYLLYDDFE